MTKNLIKLNTARNCLRYIIRAYGIEEIYVPYYICPTIKSAIRKEKAKINFYHVDKKFMPVNDFGKDYFILYPNYFGICSKNVQILSKKYKNLIVDNAHSFYSDSLGLASFNSLRKFFQLKFGIKEGAYLYCDRVLEENFSQSADYEIDDYNYENLVKNENRLDEEEILLMSKTTENIFSSIDFEQEKTHRLEKFKSFHKKYKLINQLCINLEDGEIPFVYPLLTKDENIGYELENQGLMIFRYWNGIPKHFEEYDFYKFLVPIPIC